MILLQIASALAIGAYAVLSKDARQKRPDATPRESLRPQHSADHLDRAGHPRSDDRRTFPRKATQIPGRSSPAGTR
jgi:hypothetical protein